MNVIVVRHGQSNENKWGKVNGQVDTGLSSEGKGQIRLLAQQLQNENIQAIYSSDLTRCVDTANAVRKYHKETPLALTPALREIRTGGFEGRRMFLPEPILKFVTRLAIHLNVSPPGGESWRSLNSRVALFLDDVYKTHQDKTVLIVTHGATMQAIRFNLEMEKHPSYLGAVIPNCTVWRLNMDGPIVSSG